MNDDRLQLGLVKAPPFSSTPTPVACYVDGKFVSYLGCAAEAFTVGGLPMFEGIELEIRSYCGCCYEPIVLRMVGQQIIESSPRHVKVAVLSSPYEWEYGVPADRVCDNIHFVLDETHADRLGSLHSRREVVVDVAHFITQGRPVAERRMRDREWPPLRLDGDAVVDGFAALGVAVDRWRWPHPLVVAET